VKERAVVFGPAPGLVGVLTEPEREARTRGVLLLNAGILHRIGPTRVYVALARALAEHGFPVLRFDYSGRGDSDPRADNLDYEESTILETQAAMDFVQTDRGTTDFVLMGICSGANAALRAARRDGRVAGLVMVEFLPYVTRGFRVERYLRRMLSAAAWKRLLRRGLGVWGTKIRRGLTDLAIPPEGRWDPPPVGALQAGLRELLERGTDMCFVFSSDGPSYYQYRRRIRSLIRGAPGDERVRVRLADRTDHLFTPRASQRFLVRELTDWMERATSGPSSSE
jgi:pimeloyl-ACP methyl ester carboxylesterase